MTALNIDPRLPLATTVAHRIVRLGYDVAERYRTWANARRTLKELRQLNREQLADIGLTPGDIDRFARTWRF